MLAMKFNSIKELELNGYSGFINVSDLTADSSNIPKQKGVYLVLDLNGSPYFVKKGSGGYFKGNEPNVPIFELDKKWVLNTIVLYIGLAGKNGSYATLNSRLKQYLRF